MAFIRRRRSTKGTTSTALVEAYRDDRGQPRQRILANLHGAANTLDALAKLAAQRERLRKEKAALDPEVEQAEKFYAAINTNILGGHRYSASERSEIDQLMRQRKRILQRSGKVESDLARIQKDGAVLKKHCDASDNEIQAAIKKYKGELERAETLVVGAEYMFDRARDELKELSI